MLSYHFFALPLGLKKHKQVAAVVGKIWFVRGHTMDCGFAPETMIELNESERMVDLFLRVLFGPIW